MNNLIKTYVGFSIKSNNVVIGQDQLKNTNKKVKLIMICPTASNNLVDLATRLAEKFDCKLIETDENLENYVFKENCKLIGLTNESLVKAILNVKDAYKERRIDNGK